MHDAPTKTAVRTLMRILEEKGHLTHRQEGQSFIYRPRQGPGAQAGQSAPCGRVFADVFSVGRSRRALAAHLGGRRLGT